VAERERATERLRASETERRTLIDNIPGAVYRCEVAPPWRVLYISAGIENISGHPPVEFLSGRATLGGIILPEDLDAVAAECREGIAAGRPFDLEYRIRHTDGSLRWIQERGRAVYDSDGRPRLLDGVMFDITSRIRAERALKQSEYWLNESQRISGTGSYVLDVGSGHWRSSQALDDILGIGPEYGRTLESWIALIHPDDQVPVSSHLRQDVFQHHRAFDREYRIVRACDGKTRWVHGRGALFPEEGGHSLTLAGTIQDITDRRQIEEQFRQSQKMESVGRLAGGVAHDFNNLLTVINGYSELALGTLPGDAPLRAPLEGIRKAGERAASLTRQLLAFSRRQLLQPQILDLNTLVKDTERMLQRMIGEDVRLHTVLAAGLSPVRADPGQITQVLLNLAVNARDAMPNGGHLTLETSCVILDEEYAGAHPDSHPGRFVRLVVSDSGAGMDPEVREHLFEPFFTTKPQGVGTGLGLSTVYGIVTQSGGWVHVYSEKSVGTTFKIYLPPAAGPVTAPVAVGPPSVAVSGEQVQATVLVVEDQESVRRLTSEMLMRLGHRVLEAGNGNQALGLAESHPGPIDLLLTDVVMPGMTGRQLADAFTSRRPESRVLFMSGYTDNVVARHGLLDPGVALLEKPFHLETLAQKVEQALSRVSAGTS
jgi:PAS domain S-box-containing protein